MEIALSVFIYIGCLLGGGVIGLQLAKHRLASRTSHVHQQLVKHFAPIEPGALTVTQRQFPARVRVDLQCCVDEFLRRECTVQSVMGIRTDDSMFFGMSLASFLNSDTNAATVPLQNEEVDIGDEQPVHCLRNGLWLITAQGTKAAILQSQIPGLREQPKMCFDVAVEKCPAGDELVRRFFQALEEAVQNAVSYRGKVLSLEDAEAYTGESAGITVHRLPEVAREAVILPAETLAMLERNIVRFVRQREALAERGQSTKKGILFYGPPGNGKTHTIRYILSELKGHTALLVSAEQIGRLAEYTALARLLQPTIVILEDVDLVARQRESSGPCTESLLNRLLNEMDGLKEDAQTIFLLTTNRPQQLEEALASRPGRVDQVIEFPPPDREGRGKLVRLYSPGIQLADQLVALIVQRTEGASAAFIKELMRRSLQFSLDRDDGNVIELRDVEAALEELTISGGELNRSVLGFGRKQQAATCDLP